MPARRSAFGRWRLLGACAATVAAVPAPALAQRWEARAPLGLARTEVAAVRAGDAAYVLGGFAAPGTTTAAVERYDLRTGRTRRVAPMPVALNHPAAAAWRGRVYVVGGYAASSALDEESAGLWRYDPRTDRWARLRSMPTARGALAAAVAGDRLYAIGGAADGRALTTVEVFDLRRGRWSRAPSLRRAREHLAAATAAGRVHVLAGRAPDEGNLADGEVLRGAGWSPLPAMRRARGGIAAATVGGDVVVVGGEEGAGTIREVERYDPERRRWTALPDLPTPRHGLGVVAWRGRVVALSGGDVPGLSFTAAVESLRPRG